MRATLYHLGEPELGGGAMSPSPGLPRPEGGVASVGFGTPWEATVALVKRRKRGRQVVALALILSSLLLASTRSTASPVVVVPVATQETPYTVWTTGSGSLDALGSWLFVDHEAPAGSLAPYAFVHTFGFVGATPAGAIALGYVGGYSEAERIQKVVAFSALDEVGQIRKALVPFDWQAQRHYFPLVYQPAPGFVAAAVYDAFSDRWTHVDTFAVPVEWGRLSGVSVTWAGSWRSLANCSQYPATVVTRLAPTGVDMGAIVHESTAVVSDKAPGDCPASVSIAAPQVAQYLFGSVLVP